MQKLLWVRPKSWFELGHERTKKPWYSTPLRGIYENSWHWCICGHAQLLPNFSLFSVPPMLCSSTAPPSFELIGLFRQISQFFSTFSEIIVVFVYISPKNHNWSHRFDRKITFSMRTYSKNLENCWKTQFFPNFGKKHQVVVTDLTWKWHLAWVHTPKI